MIIIDLSTDGDVYATISMSIKVSPHTKIVAFTGVGSAIRALDAGYNSLS